MFQIIRSAARLLVFSVVIAGLACLVGFQQPSFAQNAGLVQRLHELRSTSPESGIYNTQAATYNVAVTDEIISNLQTMSEHSAMAMNSTNPELKELGEKWHAESEEALAKVQEKRNALFVKQLETLRSTSPESGIQ